MHADRLENLDEFPWLGQFAGAGFFDGGYEGGGAAVHDWHFAIIDLDVAVVDAEAAQSCQQMLDGPHCDAGFVTNHGAQRQILHGMNVGGNMYQTMGVMGDYFKDRGTPVTDADFGRFAVTGRESDKFVFRVPSLRNVALTPPYFHDGSAKSLESAVATMAKYQLGRKLSNEDIDLIVAFLKSLTGTQPDFQLNAQKAGAQ